MEQPNQREVFEGTVVFIESPRLSASGKPVLKFTLRTAEKQFRCTCFGDVAKVFEESVSIGDEIVTQGFWNDYRGEQSLNVQFYQKRGKTKSGSKKKPRHGGPSASDLQEAKEYADRMRTNGYVQGWEWVDGTRTKKRFRWVKAEETRGENQLRLDWICDKLGYSYVTESFRAFLSIDNLKIDRNGELMFPTVLYRSTLDALEAEASGSLDADFNGWENYRDGNGTSESSKEVSASRSGDN